MKLRITGGLARGRFLHSPSVSGVRPTASKVRQALFNILGEKVLDAVFLDIFAGSGLIGLEALSRGAHSVTAVEINKQLARQIQKASSQFEGVMNVQTGDFRKILPKLKGQKYDLVYVDPPYQSGFASIVLSELITHQLLAKRAIVVVEHFRPSEPRLIETSLIKLNQKNYGQTALSFYTESQFLAGDIVN